MLACWNADIASFLSWEVDGIRIPQVQAVTLQAKPGPKMKKK